MTYFKYLPNDRFGFFDTYKLRFSQPVVLNDPFECMPCIRTKDPADYLETVIERNSVQLLAGIDSVVRKKQMKRHLNKAKFAMSKNLRKDPDWISKTFTERYKNHLNHNIGIFSLSKRSDSQLMWGHYASSHHGFVIGLDPDHDFFRRQAGEKSDLGTARDVQYSEHRMEIDMNDLSAQPDVFFFKNIEWQYEQEVRLVRRLGKAPPTVAGSPPVHLFDIPKSAIVSVIFGMNCENDPQSKAIWKIKGDPDLSDVMLYKAAMDPKSFKIQAVPL